MPSTTVILAGTEATYATDPGLTPSANAILTRNLSITPLEADEITRDLDIDQVGNTETELTARRASVSFEVEFAGSGTADTPPAYGVLLRGCAFSETVNVGTDVTYALIDDLDTAESVFIYVYWRGKLHKLAGGRGTVSLSAPSRDLPRLSFNFTGILVPVTESALPAAADYSAFNAPLEVGNANTVVDIGGFAPVLESLELDVGGTVNFVTRVGREVVDITNLEPSGQMTIETPALNDKDFFTDAGGTGVALSLENGSAAGQIVRAEVDQVQTMAPTYTDLDDTGDGLQIPLRPIGSGIRLITK